MFNRLSNSSAVTPLTPIKENGMNDVTTFNFRSHNVRMVIRNGEPWFVAKDVCDVLELGNTTEALRPLDDDEKITLSNPEGNPRAGNPLTFNAVNESGLYALIFKSRKPEAKEFRKWVTSEVLPSIRKTGKYEMQKVSSMPAQPPIREEVEARRFKAAQDILKTGYEMAQMFGLTGNQALLKADKVTRQLSNISPMALLEIELKSPDNEALMIATEIGKRLEPAISAKAVNLALAAMDFMERFEYRAGKFEWRLTDKGKEYGIYLDTGKVHSNGTPIQQIKWRESVISLIQQYLRVQG